MFLNLQPVAHSAVTRNRDIGPDEAAQLLNLNSARQRPLDPALIDRYAADMAAGRWGKHPPLIIVAYDDGTERLRDGQHRLHAIIASGVTLPCRVVTAYGVRGQD